jgi:hypothetical protein
MHSITIMGESPAMTAPITVVIPAAEAKTENKSEENETRTAKATARDTHKDGGA